MPNDHRQERDNKMSQQELIKIFKCLLCQNLYCEDEILLHLEKNHTVVKQIMIKQKTAEKEGSLK